MTSNPADALGAGGTVAHVALIGELCGAAVSRVDRMFHQTIFISWPDEVIVDLGALTFVGDRGVRVLVGVYLAAVEHGTRLRVVNPGGQVHDALQASGVLDVLADSDDIGALLAACLALPTPRQPGRDR